MSWQAIVQARDARARAHADNHVTPVREFLLHKFARLEAELRYIDAERHVRFMRLQEQNLLRDPKVGRAIYTRDSDPLKDPKR